VPSERHLAERFGLSRIHVREALQRLEFYGLVRTRPQSGTVVSSTDIRALDGLFEDILAFDRDDLAALLETRAAVEIQAARLAAARATDEEIADLRATRRFRGGARGNTGIDILCSTAARRASAGHASLVGCSRPTSPAREPTRPADGARRRSPSTRRSARDRGARRRRGQGHGGALAAAPINVAALGTDHGRFRTRTT
jgi:hypothetical protein